jgi:ribosomal protein L40E
MSAICLRCSARPAVVDGYCRTCEQTWRAEVAEAEVKLLRDKAARYDDARREVKTDGSTRAHYILQRDAALAEVERLREVAIEHGGCFCTWDLNDDGEDYICRPAADCPTHVALQGGQHDA